MNRLKLKVFIMYSYRAVLAAAESRLVIYHSLVIVAPVSVGLTFDGVFRRFGLDRLQGVQQSSGFNQRRIKFCKYKIKRHFK